MSADPFPFMGHEHYIAAAAQVKGVEPHRVAGVYRHPALRAIGTELHQLASRARGEAHKAAAGQPSEDLRGLAAASLDDCRARVVELEIAHIAAVAMLEHAEEMFTDEKLAPQAPAPQAPAEPEAAPEPEDESEWVNMPEDEDVDEALEEIDTATQEGEAKAKGRRRRAKK